MLWSGQISKYISIFTFTYISKYNSLQNYLVDGSAMGDNYSLQAGIDPPLTP